MLVKGSGYNLLTQLSQYFIKTVIALLNGGENVYSIGWTLGIESLLVLPFAAGHLHGNKVIACKMSIAK